MDSVPVDEEWDAVGAALAAPPAASTEEDSRSPAQVIAELRHPHLIVMHREADGAGYEADRAGGMSLAELCRSEDGWHPLPLRVSLRILLDALSGLAALHQATKGGKPLDFTHGEINPNNVIVGRDGLGRLIPLVRAHWVERAPVPPEATGYMAPERLLGDVFGQSADVFSAGVMLWEAVTGKALFRNWPLDAIVTQLIGRKVAYPIPFGDALWGVPLADVAMRALSVDPQERWNHIGALGAQIETIVRGHLASTDEIAALVAGFAAGKGQISFSDASSLPPPSSSLSPTAQSIVTPVVAHLPADPPLPDIPNPQSGPLSWEGPPSAAAPQTWLADDAIAPESPAAFAPDLSDSWNGVAPSFEAGPRRFQTVVWAVVSASFAFAGVGAYKLLDRHPQSRTTATVLAPRAAVQGAPSTPPAVVPELPQPPPAAALATADEAPLAARRPADQDQMRGGDPATNPSVGAPSPGVAAPLPSNRIPKMVVHPPAPPTTVPVVAPPTPRPPAPPAAKPATKPKEDLFGI